MNKMNSSIHSIGKILWCALAHSKFRISCWFMSTIWGSDENLCLCVSIYLSTHPSSISICPSSYHPHLSIYLSIIHVYLFNYLSNYNSQETAVYRWASMAVCNTPQITFKLQWMLFASRYGQIICM